jgi:hypothetical protein
MILSPFQLVYCFLCPLLVLACSFSYPDSVLQVHVSVCLRADWVNSPRLATFEPQLPIRSRMSFITLSVRLIQRQRRFGILLGWMEMLTPH